MSGDYRPVRDKRTNKLLFEYDPVGRKVRIKAGRETYIVNLRDHDRRGGRPALPPRGGKGD